MTPSLYNIGKKLSNTIKYTKYTLKDYILSFNVHVFCEMLLNKKAMINMSEEDAHKIKLIIKNVYV